MDHSIQDLEFLNLEGLDADTACSLRSFLVEDELHDNGEKSQLLQQDPEAIQGGFEEAEQPQYHNVNHGDITVTMGMPISTMGYHMQHPAANTMVNHHPAMYSYMNHQPTIMSYPGMFPTAGPNYYVSPGPAPGFPTHQMNNSPSYGGYQQGGGNHNKRKPGGGPGGRSRFSPRKEIPNGHHHGGEPTYYHHPGPSAYHHHHNGPYFPNNIVQAATGLPIVMHPQPVPTYIPSHPAPQVQVPAPASPVIYQHLTFAQSPLPAEIVATLAAPPEEIEETPPLQEIPPPPPVSVPEEIIVAPEPAAAAPPPPPSVPTPPPPKEEPVVAVVATPEISAPAVAVEMPEEPVVVESGAKSWASLFKKPASSGVAPPSIDKPTARVEPFTATVPIANHPKPSGPVAASAEQSRRPVVDVKTRRLAEHLSNYDLVTTPLPLLPRGLINKGNWCYINATLQALIACPSFVHLIKSLAPFSNANSKGEESITPVIDSVVDFIDQFETVPVKTGKERASAKKEEPHFGTSFEPASIYRMLSKIRSEAFKVEGRQEDAEEFLGCLLNGLHDEMIEVLKAVKGTDGSEASSQPAAAEAKPSTPEDEDWQVIGPKNRGCVTRSTSVSKTPISNLFLGMMRSALHAHSTHSSEFEPYFTLQLDIQNEKVNSVRDALACLVAKEPLTGYVCSKSGQEVEASRQTTFEELPPILILHLKCFVYDKSGGCQKLLKRVDFSSDLELSKDFLSPNQKSKLKERQRQYKLFAVVYHDGKEATKGHYVTEVHHTGTGSWLRFDDSLIRVVDTQLFKYNLPRMPYLLLYRKVNV